MKGTASEIPRIMTVLGTRPEAIKLAPVVGLLDGDERLRNLTVSTGQHGAMLDSVMSDFGLTVDANLDVQAVDQTLNQLAAKVLVGVDRLVQEHQPQAVLVQGDTTTVAMAAMAAFNRGVPVVHLEAGLRSGDLTSPFPEEANRRIVSQVASLHLAPTAEARDNLVRQGAEPSSISVTGNTVIDALHMSLSSPVRWRDPRVAKLVDSRERLLLVTAHRRENWGVRMTRIAEAVGNLLEAFPDLHAVLPMHANPEVQATLIETLGAQRRVALTQALSYREFTHLLNRCDVVLSDSGGVQEEAPSLGKPVFVLRENTERPEAVTSGTVRLVGTDPGRVVDAVAEVLSDPAAYASMAHSVNPYGDGHAAPRCLAAIRHLFGLGQRAADFSP